MKGLQLISIITLFDIKRLKLHRRVCFIFVLSLSVTKYTSKKTKYGLKTGKRGDCTKKIESFHDAVNARLKTNKTKHLLNLLLLSPRIKLRQSDNIIIDNRGTKESFVNFVCALKRKNNDFLDNYLSILKTTNFPPKLVHNKNAKAKVRET